MEQSWNLINLMSEIEFNWHVSGGEEKPWSGVKLTGAEGSVVSIDIFWWIWKLHPLFTFHCTNSFSSSPSVPGCEIDRATKKHFWRDLSERHKRREKKEKNLRHNVIDSEVIKHLR